MRTGQHIIAFKTACAMAVLSLCASGCAVPTSIRTANGGSLTHAPDGGAPPELAEDATTLTLPPNTVYVLDDLCESAPPLRHTVTMPAEAGGLLNVRRSVAKGGSGPKPPTPSEQAQGGLIKLYGAAGLAFLVGAAFMAYSRHWLAAIICGVAGICVPFLGLAFGSEWAVRAGLGLAAAAISFVCAWGIISGRYTLSPKS